METQLLYYYYIKGQRYGTVTSQQLAELYNAGKITANTKVMLLGMTNAMNYKYFKESVATRSNASGFSLSIVVKVVILIAIICFFLPFMFVSCGIQEYEFNGIDLITGFNIGGEDIEPSPLIIGALVIAVASLGLSFTKAHKTVGALCGTALALLIFFRVEINQNFNKLISSDPITSAAKIEYKVGWYGAIISLGVGGVLSIISKK